MMFECKIWHVIFFEGKLLEKAKAFSSSKFPIDRLDCRNLMLSESLIKKTLFQHWKEFFLKLFVFLFVKFLYFPAVFSDTIADFF